MSVRLLDLDHDGDLDILYSDRYGDRRGIGWLETPNARSVGFRDHFIFGSDLQVMFLDAAQVEKRSVRSGRNRNRENLHRPGIDLSLSKLLLRVAGLVFGPFRCSQRFPGRKVPRNVWDAEIRDEIQAGQQERLSERNQPRFG